MKNPTHIKKAIQLGVVALIAFMVSAPFGAEAHEIDRKSGFYFGVAGMATGLDADDTLDDTFAVEEGGGGLNFRAGWLFNPKFSLEVTLGGQLHDTSENNIIAGLGMINLFGYYHFRSDQHLRPYVKGGVGGYGLNFGEKKETDATYPRVQGAGLAFGGGIEYFLGSHFSLGADVTHHIVNYERKEIDLGDGVIQGTELNEQGSASQFSLFLTIYI